MKDKHHITKEWLQKQYWEYGKSIKAISNETDVSYQSIFRYMRKWGISRRTLSDANKKYFQKCPLSEKEKKRLQLLGQKRKVAISREQLVLLYVLQEKTTLEIAKIFSCTAPTVSSRMKEYGIPLRTPSERKMGHKNPSYGKRGKKSPRWGKKHSEMSKRKIKRNVPSGPDHMRWKAPEDRIEPVNNQIRNSYKMKTWREKIFHRDQYACVLCKKIRGADTKINADHIVPFAVIKKKHEITSLAKALVCEELWDISNGRTLCEECHKKTKTWGAGTKKLLESGTSL